MARPKSKAPARRYHLSGQSVVTLGGRDIYLGPHDSPESIARYAVLINIYQQSGLTLPDDFDESILDQQAALLLGLSAPSAVASDQKKQPILVRHITASYRQHIAVNYAADPTEFQRLSGVCNDIDKYDGDVPAEQYGPLRLQAQRQRWVDSGKARVYCNRLTNSVKRIWNYAVSQELMDQSCLDRLRSVESLRTGQTTAKEKKPIGPVDIEIVRATARHLSPVVRAMLRIQIATSMRPSEVCRMRPCEIDRSGETWVYRPTHHKTANRGKSKEVPLIDDARDAVTDYLMRDPKSYCFSPREAIAWRRAIDTANRSTPLSQGNRVGTNRKNEPSNQPGDHYDHRGYRQAICRAAQKAGVPHWNPYQLRHLAATVIRNALGPEAAQAALGHSHANMTEHYAKLSLEKAIQAAKAAPRL
jgi:integrase